VVIANSLCISYFYFVDCIISVCCLFALFTVYFFRYITVLLPVGVIKDDNCPRLLPPTLCSSLTGWRWPGRHTATRLAVLASGDDRYDCGICVVIPAVSLPGSAPLLQTVA